MLDACKRHVVALIDRIEESLSFDGPDAPRSLTRSYILAFSIIAALTIFSHFLIENITFRQLEAANLSQTVGRQRALLQQSIIYAGSYYTTGEQLDLDYLLTAVGELEEGYKYMRRESLERNLFGGYTSDVLYKAYHIKSEYGAHETEQFIKLVRDFAGYSLEGQEDVRKKAYDRITGNMSRSLIISHDLMLENFQAESLKTISDAYGLQTMSATIILIVLLLEAMFIFRPLVRKIAAYHEMLMREALEDHLTGLYNRRAFTKQVNMALAGARRSGASVAMVLTDIDHFKSVNDTHGHAAGDFILQSFAGLLNTTFRAGDIVGRVGGEEFAIMIPDADIDFVVRIMERFRKLVEDTECDFRDERGNRKRLKITSSFGVVIGDAQSWTVEALMAEADKRLYAAKHAGRNQVIAETLGEGPGIPPSEVPELGIRAQ